MKKEQYTQIEENIVYSVNRENSKATRFRVIVNMVVFLLYKNIEVVIQQEKMEEKT